MKKYLAVAGLLVASFYNVSAQVASPGSVEFGIIGGFSNYIGDLAEGQFAFKKGAGGIFIRANPHENFSFRANAILGSIMGDDREAEDAVRRARNLHFRSTLLEFSAIVEFNIFPFDPVGGGRSGGKGFTPYLFGGVGIFTFNPKAEYGDEMIELQPLGTEGQNTTFLNERKKYSLTQISFPVGLGIKFRLLPNVVMGLEYGRRITNTDYIDDVSLTYVDEKKLRAQNGNAAADLSNRTAPYREQGPYNIFTGAGNKRGSDDKKDQYAIAGLTISYAIPLRKTKCFTF